MAGTHEALHKPLRFSPPEIPAFAGMTASVILPSPAQPQVDGDVAVPGDGAAEAARAFR